MRQEREGRVGTGKGLAAGTEAASPLVVIATFVLLAVGLTALAFFLFVDTTTPLLEVQEVEGDAGPAFEVTRAQGGLRWGELEVRLLDHAGTDHAERVLALPTGGVEEGDRITLAQPVPGGDYLLVVEGGGEELVRLRTRF